MGRLYLGKVTRRDEHAAVNCLVAPHRGTRAHPHWILLLSVRRRERFPDILTLFGNAPEYLFFQGCNSMNLPEISKCPGCGKDLASPQNGFGSPGVHCNKCGFSASAVQVAQAYNLANLRRPPAIRTAAQRISKRSLLRYHVARAA